MNVAASDTRISGFTFLPEPAPKLPALATTPPGALAGQLHDRLTSLICFRGKAASSFGWTEQYVSKRIDSWVTRGSAVAAGAVMGGLLLADPACTWPLLGLLAGGAAALGAFTARVGFLLHHTAASLVCSFRPLEPEQLAFLDEVRQTGTPLDKAIAAVSAKRYLQSIKQRNVRGDAAIGLLEQIAKTELPPDMIASGVRIVDAVTQFFDPATGEPLTVIGATRGERIIALLDKLSDPELRSVAAYLDPIVFADHGRMWWDLPSQQTQVGAKLSIVRPPRDG